MLTSGPAKKVTIYVGEEQQYHGNTAYSAILEYLFFRRIAGATVTRGIAGFGADHHLHTSKMVDLATNLPIKIEFTESAETVDAVLPKLHEMAGSGAIEIHDTTLVKPPGSAATNDAPRAPALKRQSKAKLMRIYIGENDKWNGRPLHEALVHALRAHEVAGVTVYRGILGYGANRRIRSDSALSLSHDRPVVVSVVDEEEKLRALTPVLEDMVQQGLVVFSDVDVVKYTHNFHAVERRQGERQ